MASYMKRSSQIMQNKANLLRDLIAATGLVILLKMDSNRRFFSPCNLEIWWMTSKYNRAPLLYYIKLCASFQINLWIQTRVTVRKRSILVKIGDFLFRVTLKFNGWHWKTKRHLFYAAASFVHHFKSWVNSNLSYGSKTLNSVQNRRFFAPYDLEIWRMTLKTIGHLFYVASSFMRHFISISEFIFKLQAGNAHFGSKSAIFYPVWPWNLTDDLEEQ